MSTVITHMIEAVAVQVIEVNRVHLQPGRALLIAAEDFELIVKMCGSALHYRCPACHRLFTWLHQLGPHRLCLDCVEWRPPAKGARNP